MPDQADVEWFAGHGQVTLTCGAEAFARVWAAVAAAGPVDVDPAAVRMVVVCRRQQARPVNRLSDRIALLGCALVALPFLFVFTIGVQTIADWAR